MSVPNAQPSLLTMPLVTDSGSAPYLLAATVDLRAYGQAKGYRSIPIGYSATDTGALPMLQDYLACRPDASERLDFYALNSYRWCGDTTFEQSGYSIIANDSVGYPLPIFFSEVGVSLPVVFLHAYIPRVCC